MGRGIGIATTERPQGRNESGTGAGLPSFGV
jgi:hypothetical protein